MAVTAKVFGQFLMCCMRKEVDILNDDIKIMLLNSTYPLGSTQQDTYVYLNDLLYGRSNWEVTSSQKATGTFTITDVISDGETVTIGEGTYEFDLNSSYTPGNIPVVPLSTSIEDARDALVDAIDNNTSEAITVLASYSEPGVLYIYGFTVGPAQNSIITTTTCANASWAAETMLGGTDVGYLQGGKILTDKALTYSTSNYIYFKPEQTNNYVQWDNSTISARYAVVYDANPDIYNKPLIGYIDFGQVFTSDAGYFKITFNTSGLIRVTIS